MNRAVPFLQLWQTSEHRARQGKTDCYYQHYVVTSALKHTCTDSPQNDTAIENFPISTSSPIKCPHLSLYLPINLQLHHSIKFSYSTIGISQDFWLGGPVNFHHWLRLPWTTLVTVRVANKRHWKYGTNKNRAPKARGVERRGVPFPRNFSNFCLDIACYSAFWKPFFRLDSSLFTDQIVTLTQRQVS